MTKKQLFREVGNIDDKYIVEAEETKRTITQNVIFRRSLATAACLMVCLGLYLSTRTVNKETTSDSSSSMNSYHNALVPQASEENSQSGPANWNIMQDVEINDKSEDFWGDSNREQEVASSEMSSTEGIDEEMQEDVTEELFDDQKMIERLSAYPNEYEALLQTEAFVVVQGTVKSGMDQWDAFLEGVEEGEPAYVEVVQFTEEGDAIISAIRYNEEYFYVLEDHSRDVWGNTGWVEYEYGYLYLDIQDGKTSVVLSDLKLEGEEIRDAIIKNPEKFAELIQYTNN